MKFVSPLSLSLFLALSISAQSTLVGAKPTFAALDMNGQRVDTATLNGKVVVLNLWFVGCPNCVEEIDLLNRLVDQYKGYKDVVFLGLAASPKASLESFLRKYPFKYQIVPNSQMIIITKFGMPDKRGEINVPFPMHFLIDRTGKIVFGGQGIKSIDGLKAALAAQTGGR